MLVGRDTELAVLNDRLHAASEGAGQVVVLEGEPGIGKSALLAALVSSATDHAVTTLVARCDELGGARPFGPILDAFSEMRWEVSGSDQPGGVEVGARSAPFESGPEARTMMLESVIARFEDQCVVGPVALLIDDVQWADGATLLTLASLARRAGDLPMLVVLGVRPSPRPAELDALLDGLTRPHPLGRTGPASAVTHLDLAPLEPGDALALAAEVAGGTPGPALRSMLDRCDGNPLFVLEMVGALREAGLIEIAGPDADAKVGPGDTPLPASLTESVRSKVARFEGETRAVAALASLLGSRFTVADLVAATDRTAAALFPLVQELVEARLLIDDGAALSFRHDLVREAVAAAVPPSVRAELHRTIALQLQATGAPAMRVAEHLVIGAVPGSPEAAAVLREAALEISSRDPIGAAGLLRRALEVCPRDDPMHDIVIADLVDALAWSGRTAEACSLADDLLSRAVPPEVEERVRSAVGRSLVLLGRPHEAIAHEERLIDLYATLGRSPAWAHAECAVCRLFGLDLDGALADGAAAVERGERDGDAMAVILGLCVQTFAFNTLGDSARAVEFGTRAVAVADSTPQHIGHRLAPHLFRGVALTSNGDKTAALEGFRIGRSLGEALGAAWALPIYHFVTALAHWDTGEWDDLLAEVEAGVRFGEERGSAIGQLWAFAVAGRVHVHRGDLVAAEATLAAADRVMEAGGLQVGVDWLVLSKALLLEAQGQRVEGLELLRIGWDMASGLRASASLGHFGAELARLATEAGDEELARRVVDSLASIAASNDQGDILRGRYLRAAGLVQRDPQLMIEAAAVFERLTLRVEAAQSKSEAGDLLLAAGRANEASALFDAALDVFDTVGAQREADAVRTRLARLAPSAKRARAPRRAVMGWEALTPTEREVVDEVCAGRSNREVAERLGVSRRTVEAHLRAVYPKLGVATRLALVVAWQSRE